MTKVPEHRLSLIGSASYALAQSNQHGRDHQERRTVEHSLW
jgi:hypothetical protein